MLPDYSYWEKTAFIAVADVIVIGSGLVGLSAAISIKQSQPKLNVTVLDSGFLPSGASTKNAGFACFGTVSEQLAVINRSSEYEMLRMVDYKYRGLQQLRSMLGDNNIGYHQYGGYELFFADETAQAEAAFAAMPKLNRLIGEVTGDDDIYSTADDRIADFGFAGVKHMIRNKYEGQLHTGWMMRALLAKAQQAGVLLLNNCTVQKLDVSEQAVNVLTSQGNFSAGRVIIANNAFAKQLAPQLYVIPGRGQVLVTKPITGLKIKGTFHFNEGYYYFRNIDDRVLFGGGRNLDFKAEETTEFGYTEKVQRQLLHYLNDVILPGQPVEIDYGWSGIMGFGEDISPIIKQLQPNVYCAVRCNGMGVAMGSLVGQDVAQLVLKNL